MEGGLGRKGKRGGVSSTAAVGNMVVAEAETKADSSNISLHFSESYLPLEHANNRIQDNAVKCMGTVIHDLSFLK